MRDGRRRAAGDPLAEPRLPEGGRVLVTGATGFVGGHLTRALLRQPGVAVRALVRSPARAAAVAPAADRRLELAIGALGDRRALREACRDVALVLHCAALGPSSFGPGDRPSDYAEVNREGTRRLLEEAARAGAQRFVCVSTTGVMGPGQHGVVGERSPCHPASPYEISKYEAERCVLEFAREGALEAVAVRPCLVTGPGKRGGELLRLFRLCRRGVFPVFGEAHLESVKPLVDVEDLVQALLRAAAFGRSGEVYLVHSGARHTLGRILEVAGRLVGNPRPFRRVPLPLGRAAAVLLPPLARLVGRTPPLSRERLQLYLASREIEVGKARRELGYRPAHQDLDDMLGRTCRDLVASGQL